jgi:uncharacterized membrane-anchored protein
VRDDANKRITDMPNRVPEVTLAFWVIKIMSTTVGETGADYLAVHVGLGTSSHVESRHHAVVLVF